MQSAGKRRTPLKEREAPEGEEMKDMIEQRLEKVSEILSSENNGDSSIIVTESEIESEPRSRKGKSKDMAKSGEKMSKRKISVEDEVKVDF